MNSNFPPKLKRLFLKYQPSEDDLINSNIYQIKNTHYKHHENKKLTLISQLQTDQSIAASAGHNAEKAFIKYAVLLGTIQALRHHVFDFFRATHFFDDSILEWSLTKKSDQFRAIQARTTALKYAVKRNQFIRLFA